MNKLVPYALMAGMLAMVFVSWKSVMGYHSSIAESYQTHIENAEDFMSKKIYIDAVGEYEAALKIKSDDYDTAMKIVDLYDKLNKETDWEKACRNAIESDKTQKEPYILLADHYMEASRYQKAYTLLTDAQKVLGEDEDVLTRKLELKGMYTKQTLYYNIISDIYYPDSKSKGYYIYTVDGKKGLINNSGKIEIEAAYDEIGFPGQKVIPVKESGEWYYIDENGYRKLVPDSPAEFLGSFYDNYAPAKLNGMYGYVDKKMKMSNVELDEAGLFSNGIAAVRKGDKWGIISSSLKMVTDFCFDDILMDTNGVCSSYGVFWGKINGQYCLYDKDGKCLSEPFENVKLFASNEPAAVKKDGKWGYVSKQGEIVISPAYTDAQSFSAGYAPVQINDKWGCIDSENHLVIQPEFDSITAFSRSGYAIATAEETPMFLVVTIYDS